VRIIELLEKEARADILVTLIFLPPDMQQRAY
jgi:hypothetical protein